MCYGLQYHEVLVQRRIEKRYFEGGSVDVRMGNLNLFLKKEADNVYLSGLE